MNVAILLTSYPIAGKINFKFQKLNFNQAKDFKIKLWSRIFLTIQNNVEFVSYSFV